MSLVHPPLPTASNFVFQAEAGSQTSILMSESEVGLIVAATRQNAGRSRYATACGGPFKPRPAGPAGGANVPAATGCASVIVVSWSFRLPKVSQVAA